MNSNSFANFNNEKNKRAVKNEIIDEISKCMKNELTPEQVSVYNDLIDNDSEKLMTHIEMALGGSETYNLIKERIGCNNISYFVNGFFKAYERDSEIDECEKKIIIKQRLEHL